MSVKATLLRRLHDRLEGDRRREFEARLRKKGLLKVVREPSPPWLSRARILERAPGKWTRVWRQDLDPTEVLVVYDEKGLKEARERHPDTVVYMEAELDVLDGFVSDPQLPDLLRVVHWVKSNLDGWIEPDGESDEN